MILLPPQIRTTKVTADSFWERSEIAVGSDKNASGAKKNDFQSKRMNFFQNQIRTTVESVHSALKEKH